MAVVTQTAFLDFSVNFWFVGNSFCIFFSFFWGFLPDFLFQNENICKVCWLRRPRCYPTSFSPTIHPGLATATKAPNIPNYPSISSIAISKYPNTLISNILFLDAIASPSTYPCQWLSGSLIVSDWRLLLHLRALRACFFVEPFPYKNIHVTKIRIFASFKSANHQSVSQGLRSLPERLVTLKTTNNKKKQPPIKETSSPQTAEKVLLQSLNSADHSNHNHNVYWLQMLSQKSEHGGSAISIGGTLSSIDFSKAVNYQFLAVQNKCAIWNCSVSFQIDKKSVPKISKMNLEFFHI